MMIWKGLKWLLECLQWIKTLDITEFGYAFNSSFIAKLSDQDSLRNLPNDIFPNKPVVEFDFIKFVDDSIYFCVASYATVSDAYNNIITPVCGYKNVGQKQTYNNEYIACQDANVNSWIKGSCEW